MKRSNSEVIEVIKDGIKNCDVEANKKNQILLKEHMIFLRKIQSASGNLNKLLNILK